MFGFLEVLDLLKQVFIFFGYFTNSGSFPKPLSKEEEQELFVKFYEYKNSDAKEKLINHNLRLVAHIVKKYHTCQIPQEDLISIGIIGLIKGINSFDYKKGTKFATYASRCIENEILMSLRSESKNSMDVFLEDIIGVDEEGNNISFLDVLDNEEDDVHQHVDKKIQVSILMDTISKVLTKREKEIIYLRYGLKGIKKCTQLEIASNMGISRSYVSRIEKKALEKLAKAFVENSNDNYLNM